MRAMARRLRIIIMYGPVPIATTADPSVMAAAAQAALAESVSRACTLDHADPALGIIERGETERLRQVFNGLGLSTDRGPVM